MKLKLFHCYDFLLLLFPLNQISLMFRFHSNSLLLGAGQQWMPEIMRKVHGQQIGQNGVERRQLCRNSYDTGSQSNCNNSVSLPYPDFFSYLRLSCSFFFMIGSEFYLFYWLWKDQFQLNFVVSQKQDYKEFQREQEKRNERQQLVQTIDCRDPGY